MVKINGELQNAAGLTIAEYLRQAQFDLTRIAVERNEAFVPKAQYDQILLEDGDVVEIVRFVGGG